MKLSENPFFILNIANRTNFEKIQEICNTNKLLMSDEKYNDYENILINSNQRLEAELNWFPGISEEQLEDIRYEIKNLHEYNIISQITICRKLLENENNSNAVRVIINKLDKLLNEGILNNLENIFNLINEDRKYANFQLVNDKSKIEECIEKLRNQVINEVLMKFESFSETKKITFLKKIAIENRISFDNNRIEEYKVVKNNIYEYGNIEKKIYESFLTSFDKKIEKNKNIIINMLREYNPRTLSLNSSNLCASNIHTKIDTWYKYTELKILYLVQNKGEEQAFSFVLPIFELLIDKVKLLNGYDNSSFSMLRESVIKISEHIPSIANGFKKILKEEREMYNAAVEEYKTREKNSKIVSWIIKFIIFIFILALSSGG